MNVLFVGLVALLLCCTSAWAKCVLPALGQKFNVDKFNANHRYEHLYCDILAPLHKHTDNFTMLEIGLGCGHFTSCPRSAPLWKTYFPQADYYAIDYIVGDQTTVYNTCMANLKKEFPSVSLDLTGKVFFGDQADRSFLRRVVAETVKKTNKKFQLIIDDGGHKAVQEIVSFQELWPYLEDGGIYVVEDLQADDGFPRAIANWMFLLTGGYTTSVSESSPNFGEVDDFTFKNRLPRGIKTLGCSHQICYFMKLNPAKESFPAREGSFYGNPPAIFP